MQIHHIDSNSGNNKAANLAVTCLDCHSNITGRRSLGQSYSMGEVRKYKRSWDKRVLDKRRVHRPQIRYKKELVSQIDLVICDILARKQNNPRVEELLNILFELHLWRGGPEIDAKIVEGLHHLAFMSGLSYPRIASLVAEKLWEMCFHFVGPEDVDMDKKEQKYVLDCIDALRTLAEFNSEFGHGRKAAGSIAENSENFFEIALWYNRRNIANAILRTYEKSLKACYEEGKLNFAFARTLLRKSLRKVRKLLNEQHSEWTHQHRRIEVLLKL
ncbi:MAG: HNH endonuclease [Planctomycetes bacterium]|nr:HNH endonuclease [Planctomycetota bacterium]